MYWRLCRAWPLKFTISPRFPRLASWRVSKTMFLPVLVQLQSRIRRHDEKVAEEKFLPLAEYLRSWRSVFSLHVFETMGAMRLLRWQCPSQRARENAGGHFSSPIEPQPRFSLPSRTIEVSMISFAGSHYGAHIDAGLMFRVASRCRREACKRRNLGPLGKAASAGFLFQLVKRGPIKMLNATLCPYQNPTRPSPHVLQYHKDLSPPQEWNWWS